MKRPSAAAVAVILIVTSVGVSAQTATAQAAPPKNAASTGFLAQISGDSDCTGPGPSNPIVPVKANGKPVSIHQTKTITVTATGDPSDTVTGKTTFSTRATLKAPSGQFASTTLTIKGAGSTSTPAGSGTACDDSSLLTYGGMESMLVLKRPGTLTARLTGSTKGLSSCGAQLSGPARWFGGFGKGALVAKSSGLEVRIKAPKGVYSLGVTCGGSVTSTGKPASFNGNFSLTYSRH